jgi:hypothetical protein
MFCMGRSFHSLGLGFLLLKKPVKIPYLFLKAEKKAGR